MSSEDFRRIKLYEILFNFWLAVKIQNHMKLIFVTRERKRERKAKIGETARQNNDEYEVRARKMSAKCKLIVMGKKSDLEKWKILI